MNHEQDYDRDHARAQRLSERSLKDILQDSIDLEEELMRRYLITAERIHDNEELQIRLRNFSEGNAKRSAQLIDELRHLQ